MSRRKLDKGSLIKAKTFQNIFLIKSLIQKNESNVVHKIAPTVHTLMQALHEIFMVKEKITRSFFIG